MTAPLGQHLQFSVSLDPSAPATLTDAVTFETGASRSEVRLVSTFAYNHHGEGFTGADPGALTAFFEDLVLGRPMPTRFVSHRVDGPDTLMAMAVFLHRDLAILPRTPGFVATIDLVHRRGLPMLGHLDPEVENLYMLLDEVPASPDAAVLQQSFERIRDYLLTGEFEPGPVTEPRILDVGTDGFVVAALGRGSILRAWTWLFRRGWLRGVLFGPELDGYRQVSVCRKSAYVSLDLVKAAGILNEMEAAMGEPPHWATDGQWMMAPTRGTRIVPEHLIEVLLRV